MSSTTHLTSFSATTASWQQKTKARTASKLQREGNLYALHARGGGVALPGEEEYDTRLSLRQRRSPIRTTAVDAPVAAEVAPARRLAARVGIEPIRALRARLTPALRASLRAARCGEPPWSVAQCQSILRRFLHQMSTAPLGELRELITLDQAVAIAGLRSAKPAPLGESTTEDESGSATSQRYAPPTHTPLAAAPPIALQPSPPILGERRLSPPGDGMLRASSDAVDSLVLQLNDSVVTLLLDALEQSEERVALRAKFVDALAGDQL